MIITGKYPQLRLRRNRQHNWSRRLVRENTLSVNDLVQPIFLIEGKNKKVPVKSMPNINRYSVDSLTQIVDKCVSKLKEDIKSFHLRLIALIRDHFEVFYRQKTDLKWIKIGQNFFKNYILKFWRHMFDEHCFGTSQAFI